MTTDNHRIGVAFGHPLLAAFLDALAVQDDDGAVPDHATPGVFADWLEEQGDARAECVRALAEAELPAPPYARLHYVAAGAECAPTAPGAEPELEPLAVATCWEIVLAPRTRTRPPFWLWATASRMARRSKPP